MKKVVDWNISKKILGVLLIILGVIGLFLPILQGILFISLGILLLKGKETKKLIVVYNKKFKKIFQNEK